MRHGDSGFCGYVFTDQQSDPIKTARSRTNARRLIRRVIASPHPPEVLVLTQLHAFQSLWRLNPRPGMSELEIERAGDVAQRIPSSGSLFKYSHILAVNGRTADAELWLLKTSKVVSSGQWKTIESVWKDMATRDAAMATVRFPRTD